MRVTGDGDDVMMARRGHCLLVLFAVCSLPFCSSRFEDVGIFACCFVLGCLRSMGTVHAVLVVEVGSRGGQFGPSLD